MNIRGLIIDGWQQLETMPDDPEETIALGKMTSMAQCFVRIYPIRDVQVMPFDNTKVVIEGIHQSLANSQALIEVNNGRDSNGCRFIYSIIKNRLEPSGVQYFLRAHIEIGIRGVVSEINGFFDESGTTGLRDSTIYQLAVNKGIILPGSSNHWQRDPYDATFDRPYLMNMSENEEFDKCFPEHPLSLSRKLIQTIIVK